MDKVIVEGLGKPLDGEYECDVAGMFTQGHPEALTYGEARRIKLVTGIRLGELEDAMQAGDSDALVGFCVVVIERTGKRVNEQLIWDAPVGGGISLELGDDETDGEDDADPPTTSGEQQPTEPHATNGGQSTTTQSEPTPASDPSPTGLPSSETDTSAQDSDPAISPV